MIHEKLKNFISSRRNSNPASEENGTKLTASLFGLERCRNNTTINAILDRDSWKTIQRVRNVYRILWVLAFITTLIVAIVEFSEEEFVPYDALLVCVCLPIVSCYAAIHNGKRLGRGVALICTIFQSLYRIVVLIYIHVQPDVYNVDNGTWPHTEIIACIVVLVVSIPLSTTGILFARKRKAMENKAKYVQVIGLDNAGKTSLMYHIAPVEEGVRRIDINPTPGIQLFRFNKWDTEWRVWDLSGQGRNRELWSAYYSGVHAIIFVVDSCDIHRIGNAKDELHRMLAHPEVKQHNPLILILINKSDLLENQSGLTTDQARKLFQIDTVGSRYRVKMLSSSGMTGAGIQQGFQWIKDQTRSEFN